MIIMTRMALVFLLTLTASVNSAQAEARNPLEGLMIPPSSIVLFWAAWCAPCRAEIAAWPALQQAAGAIPLYVIALDTPIERSRTLLKSIPADRVRHGGGSTFSVLAGWPQRASGLPFAVLLDAQGRVCASQNGGLDADRITGMKRQCGVISAAKKP